jgi:hypothetical protein
MSDRPIDPGDTKGLVALFVVTVLGLVAYGLIAKVVCNLLDFGRFW